MPNVTRNFIRGAIFSTRLEQQKEVLVGRERRYRDALRTYTSDSGFGVLLLKCLFYFPAFWIFVATVIRLVVPKKQIFFLARDGRLVREHSSKCFSKHYLGERYNNEVTVSLKRFFKLKVFLKHFCVIYKIISKERVSNPEVLTKYLWAYVTWAHYLRHQPHDYTEIIVNDDFMPTDFGVLTASKDLGLGVAAFRVNDAIGRLTSPIKLNQLFCMSTPQFNEYSRCHKKILVKKQTVIVRTIQKTNRPFFVVGVPLPSKFNIKTVCSKLMLLSSELPLVFRLRLHPEVMGQELRDRYKRAVDASIFRISDCHETIEEFASDLDFVIAGNTSAAKDLLDLGSPVLYRGDLDDNPFDFHNWIALGKMFNFTNSHVIFPSEVNEFYSGLKEEILENAQK